MTKQIAVITGATRGIGLETARQLGARAIACSLPERHKQALIAPLTSSPAKASKHPAMLSTRQTMPQSQPLPIG